LCRRCDDGLRYTVTTGIEFMLASGVVRLRSRSTSSLSPPPSLLLLGSTFSLTVGSSLERLD